MPRPCFNIECFTDADFTTHIITDVGNIHNHTFFEFSYVLQGCVKHITPKRINYYTNNTLLILRPEKDYHSFDEEHNHKAYHRDILIEPELFKSVCDFLAPEIYDDILNPPDIIELPLSNDDMSSLENSLKLYSISDHDESSSVALKKGIIVHLITIYLKKHQKTSLKNQTLIDIIEKMKTPEVLQNGIPALVKEVNLSHGHLCRLIKQNFNMTVLELLTEFRMEKAALLLKYTNTELLDISYQVGYESLSHFISNFKTKYKIPPNQYRKNFSFNPKKE